MKQPTKADLLKRIEALEAELKFLRAMQTVPQFVPVYVPQPYIEPAPVLPQWPTWPYDRVIITCGGNV